MNACNLMNPIPTSHTTRQCEVKIQHTRAHAQTSPNSEDGKGPLNAFFSTLELSMDQPKKEEQIHTLRLHCLICSWSQASVRFSFVNVPIGYLHHISHTHF